MWFHIFSVSIFFFSFFFQSPIWEFEDEFGIFKPYPNEISKQLENGTCPFLEIFDDVFFFRSWGQPVNYKGPNNYRYEINPQTLIQVNTSSKKRRTIRRREESNKKETVVEHPLMPGVIEVSLFFPNNQLVPVKVQQEDTFFTLLQVIEKKKKNDIIRMPCDFYLD